MTPIVEQIADVLREQGYQGASLSRLANATGLKRASLYHRFPGGKEEMAATALHEVGQFLTDEVLASLYTDLPVATRLAQYVDGLSLFYQDGWRSCLLDVLSLGEGTLPFRAKIDELITGWIAAMAHVSRDSGFNEATAQQRAEEAVMLIEGALVVSRGRSDAAPFQRMLARLPGLLLKA